jgi:transcription factor TFIIIB component B''
LTPSKKARQIEQTDENQIQTATLNIAPQLKIAEDGSVVINEESLFIREKEAVYEETIIENENNDGLTYNSYRKFHHTKKWSRKETAKFYKALSMVGTDFTMIQRLFSYRNRDEIKRKFKREEKINQALIDKILSKTSQVDLSVFVSSASENEDNRDNSSENTSAKRAKKKLQKKQQSENGSTASGTENLKPDQSITQNEKRKKEKLKRVKKSRYSLLLSFLLEKK